MIFDKSKFEKFTKPRKLKYIQENDFLGFNTKNAVMVLYCIENDLTDVVYAPCGSECKNNIN
ncbi:homing endonuclease EDxHD [Klebsiella phage K64-1]|uniref:homing endonuclease EDxHD n=1 Tax=Klebsiella phage K64-1 TaxID=1439894 RepID=UPI00248BAB7B|nr:homing endonuclease EDxHD [Klebsiella phage K64-1]